MCGMTITTQVAISVTAARHCEPQGGKDMSHQERLFSLMVDATHAYAAQAAMQATGDMCPDAVRNAAVCAVQDIMENINHRTA